MGTSKRYNVYYGQIIEPYFKYFLNANFYITPYDHKGNKIAKHMYSNWKNANKKLLIPEFKLNISYNDKISDSYLDVLFKGNYNNRYVFNKRSYFQLEKNIHYYNKILENDLVQRDEDIEYPDELGQF